MNKTEIEFTAYCANLITVAKQVQNSMSITLFLEAFASKDKKRVLQMLIDLDLVACDSFYSDGEPKSVRWIKNNGPRDC